MYFTTKIFKFIWNAWKIHCGWVIWLQLACILNNKICANYASMNNKNITLTGSECGKTHIMHTVLNMFSSSVVKYQINCTLFSSSWSKICLESVWSREMLSPSVTKRSWHSRWNSCGSKTPSLKKYSKQFFKMLNGIVCPVNTIMGRRYI